MGHKIGGCEAAQTIGNTFLIKLELPITRTTDNYNTETSEHYHIDVAKRAWVATNH